MKSRSFVLIDATAASEWEHLTYVPDLVSLSTMSAHEEDDRLAVSGYCRRIVTIDVPSDIIEIIFTFYNVAMEWDLECNERCKERLQLQENSVNSIKLMKVGYASAIAKEVVCGDIYKRCYYEILIEKFCDDLFVGYLKYDENGYKLSDHVGSNQNKSDGFSVYLYGRQKHFDVYNNKKKHTLEHESMKRGWQIGDIIGIELDFEKNESKAYFNGICVGTMFKKIPKKIVPAVSLFWPGTTISSPTFRLTRW